MKGDSVEYYVGGKGRPFGSGGTGSGVEMLLGKYSFAVYYNGAWQQHSNWDVETNPVVRLKTIPVKVSFWDSHGYALEGNRVEYYANGWRTLGVADSNGEVLVEILPVKYSFAIYYNGTRQQHSNWDVQANPVVHFETLPVTINIQDSNGNALQGGRVEYYASSWRTLGTSDEAGVVSVELLSGKYRLRSTLTGCGGRLTAVMSEAIRRYA